MLYLTQLQDAQLVNEFKNGNNQALEELLNRYKSRIFSAIYFLVKDKFLAEDIFQETFIKIIDTIKAEKYLEEGKFLPWSIRIAHNLCIDHFRKVKRKPTVTTENGMDLFDFLGISEESSEEKLSREEQKHHIQKLLDLLPYDQKEVIILRVYANLNFKEIAKMTHCSINTALSRMRYSLINLRKIIEERQIAL